MKVEKIGEIDFPSSIHIANLAHILTPVTRKIVPSTKPYNA